MIYVDDITTLDELRKVESDLENAKLLLKEKECELLKTDALAYFKRLGIPHEDVQAPVWAAMIDGEEVSLPMKSYVTDLSMELIQDSKVITKEPVNLAKLLLAISVCDDDQAIKGFMFTPENNLFRDYPMLKTNRIYLYKLERYLKRDSNSFQPVARMKIRWEIVK